MVGSHERSGPPSFSRLSVLPFRCSGALYPFERKRFWIDPPQRYPAPAAPLDSQFEPTSSAAAPDQPASVAVSLSDIEQTMRKVWRDVLGGEVGLDDNFFDLGGHSLAAVALLGEIDHVFGQRFSLEALMNAPTVRAFSAQLTAQNQPTRKDSEQTPQSVADALRKFLADNGFLTNADLTVDDSLLDRGIVDETNLLLLIEFIEENYGLNIEDEDLVSSNFHSIRSISEYVLTRVNSGVLSAA
jgi:acyl carrier protein